MENLKKYYLKNSYKLNVIFILILAIFLRFYNYLDRFGIAYDQAHDVIVAAYALQHNLVPLVGPFSSAGPFQTGGEWYWFIMLGVSIFPRLVLSPWIFLTTTYVIFAYLMIRLGESLEDKNFGIILGLLTAVSTAGISQSINLTNQGPEAVISFLALWQLILFIKGKKNINIFLAGFLVSLGISIHLQMVALYLVLFIGFLFAQRYKLKTLFLLALGASIPFIPILIFDLQNSFVNTRSMIQYFLHDQYQISLDVLGRRWLTYAGVFWPKAWSLIIGGIDPEGYLIMGGIVIISLFKIVTRKVNKIFLFTLISFFACCVVLRYIRTPLFDSYVTFLHPFVLLLTGWLIYYLYSRKKFIGIALLIIVVSGSLFRDYKEITYPGSNLYTIVNVWHSVLDKQFPGERFTFYSYQYKNTAISVPFVLLEYSKLKTDDAGHKIGITFDASGSGTIQNIILASNLGYRIVDLNSSNSAQLSKAGWVNINPSTIYNSTENWRNQ